MIISGIFVKQRGFEKTTTNYSLLSSIRKLGIKTVDFKEKQRKKNTIT
jgi:hypothetical protein